MTKPKNNAAINGTHFQFLSTQISSGKFCLSVDEARRFVYIAKELVSCAVWDKKVDREAVAKVAKVVEKAMQDAEYKCQGLPFSLPNDKKLDGGEYSNSNFRAPDLF